MIEIVAKNDGEPVWWVVIDRVGNTTNYIGRSLHRNKAGELIERRVTVHSHRAVSGLIRLTYRFLEGIIYGTAGRP